MAERVRLADIRERVGGFCCREHAKDDATALLAALDAVLNQHQPNRPQWADGAEACEADDRYWPCPTRAAIESVIDPGAALQPPQDRAQPTPGAPNLSSASVDAHPGTTTRQEGGE